MILVINPIENLPNEYWEPVTCDTSAWYKEMHGILDIPSVFPGHLFPDPKEYEYAEIMAAIYTREKGNDEFQFFWLLFNPNDGDMPTVICPCGGYSFKLYIPHGAYECIAECINCNKAETVYSG